MNWKGKIIIIIHLIILSGCLKDAVPEIKEYPVIKILKPTHIDSSGITLNAEYINHGSEKTIAFGFVWDTEKPDILNSDTTIISYQPEIKTYSIRLRDGFIKGYAYKVQAFAYTENNVVYSNTIDFKSLGSQYCPWQQLLNYNFRGIYYSFGYGYGMSNNKCGYILFSHMGDFYELNMIDNIIIKKQNFPNSNRQSFGLVATLNIDNNLYFICAKSKIFWQYSNDAWHNLGQRPDFNFSSGIIGFSVNGKGYFGTGSELYEYNEETGFWISKKPIPTSKVYSSAIINEGVYVIGANKEVFKSDSILDNWSYVSDYPGILEGQLIGFSLKEKAYFGLNYASGFVVNRFIWEYDPKKNSWNRLCIFPRYKLYQSNITLFTIDGKAYFGVPLSDFGSFQLFEFNPDKLIQKN